MMDWTDDPSPLASRMFWLRAPDEMGVNRPIVSVLKEGEAWWSYTHEVVPTRWTLFLAWLRRAR